MTYEINVEQIDVRLHRVTVRILDNNGEEILSGETHVATDDPQVAYDYAERTFLPDLRRCYPFELNGLVFPWEVMEPTVDGGDVV